jgi:glycosyltransferase involved in cell wall biosynthesis
MASGAAPGRGIEQLVAAMAGVRAEVPEATLRLALAASGPASRAYLNDLRADLTDPWVTVTEVPHAGLDAFLAETAVLVVPHPPGAYMDAAAPVKVFDAMASGRPLVITPRFETRKIVEEAGAGSVAAGDEVDDLAAAIWELLHDESRRRSQGDNARRTAVERYDWRILSAQLADAVLGPQNASR